MPEPLTDVVVSIQVGAEHVAAGLLGDRDLVLVPEPSRVVLDPGQELSVVTIPRPLSAGYTVERLYAACVNVMWVGGDRDRPVAAMLKLRTPSQYAPTIGAFTGATLAGALERSDNQLWPALEALGVVDPERRNGPPDDVLAQLPDIERRQRQANYRDHEHGSGTEIGWSICRWLCICHPR
jgi:hypothetical protein